MAAPLLRHILRPNTIRSAFLALSHKNNNDVPCRYLRNSKNLPPFLKEQVKRRKLAGPEPIRHPSAFGSWNYDAELFAFGKRVGEDFDEEILKEAFIVQSSIEKEAEERKKVGVEIQMLSSICNEELSLEGKQIVQKYLKAYLRFNFPYMFEEGIGSICDFLMNTELLAHVGKLIGITDLIQSKYYPPTEEEMSETFLAIVAALGRSQSEERAGVFVVDFLTPRLVGKDVNEMWKLDNPMGLLSAVLQSKGMSTPESRLLWQTGCTSIMSVYHVGIYSDKELIGRSPGETLAIAEEQAAREALKNLMKTDEARPPLQPSSNVPLGSLDLDKKNPSAELLLKLYSESDTSSQAKQTQ
ncbi:39S ribosomal protein L44, mitochondrial-like [Ostrea edulis]|uniref:39S ribosomal protein L44, mitochondrial-like n=1 Tax=Ostrea edulis TaxID=37623 RepID=UPI0024AEBED8|nr:39S ribosomal protein L44, mitochondrial-like [Ostrea edulis]